MINNFEFNEADWQLCDDETEGSTENMVWLELKSDSAVRALFKPDVSWVLPASAAEYESAKLSHILNIPCAKIEIVKYRGINGTLSFNVKNNYYKYVTSAEFADEHDIPRLSLQEIRENYPQIENDMINMLFLDCLIKNDDRHDKNWEIKCDKKTGAVLGLCPLFDFNQTLNRTQNDRCRVLYSYSDPISLQFKHFEIFERLCADYLLQIKSLLDIANAISDLNDFVKKRLATMNRLYEISRRLN